MGLFAENFSWFLLPTGYVVPPGKILSWQLAIEKWSPGSYPLYLRPEPAEAFFYLGSAWAQVTRGPIKDYEYDRKSIDSRHRIRILTITVQSTCAEDLVKLRDRVMNIIRLNPAYGVSNDLNPKPGFFERVGKFLQTLVTKPAATQKA